MKIKEININELIEYDNNPRNNDESVELVANSIKEFGFKVPLVIDKNNVIIAGHTRLKASKYLGLKKVPCIIADDLTPEQIKAFRLADNKVSEKSTWNMEKLQNELLELKVIDFNIENFGFETSDIDISNVNTDEILDKFKNNITTDEIVEDEIPEVAEDPICKLGDIWLLGNHKLMCGDSTNQESVNKLFGDEISDLLITSPPYNIGDGATLRQHLEKGQKNERLNTLYNSYNDDVDYIDFIQQMYNVSKTKTKSQFINIQMLGGNKQDFIKFIYNNLNCFVDLIIWNNHTCPPQMRENILNNYFEYSKVREDLFDVLMELGSLEDAQRRAKRIYDEYVSAKIYAPSAMVSATRMFELVEELEKYLEK